MPVEETYGIDLTHSGLEPGDWIVIDYDNMASGDYVGRWRSAARILPRAAM